MVISGCIGPQGDGYVPDAVMSADATRMSHAELNEAAELDDGNPDELGAENAALRRRPPGINVLGGYCGTDHRHIDAMCVHALAA